MYWYRMETSLGNRSLVGSTIKNPSLLPEHLNSDEKHSHLKGKKVYVATTVADGCILGAELSTTADESGLTEAYGVFKSESQQLNPNYQPKTVTTDGWAATKKSFSSLFPHITLLQCFLHIFIKIRDRSKRKYRDQFLEAADRLWNCYKAETKQVFSQRVRRLYEWSLGDTQLPEVIRHPIKKLRENIKDFKAFYDFENAFRTSNMVDRLMQRMDHHLFDSQYFSGNFSSAKKGIRAWALTFNFAPFNPMTVAKHQGIRSPAEKLNGKKYHDNWLQNLLISSSMAGFPP